VARDFCPAFQREGRAPELPLVAGQGIEERHIRQQRRERLVGGDVELEGAAHRVAVAVCPQRDRHRHGRRALVERAGDRGRTILPHRPDDLTHGGDLERRHQARHHRVDERPPHRELRRTDGEEGVSETVEFVAVDVRDRPGGPHFDVTADERHAERVPFAEGAGHRGQFFGRGAAADSTSRHREAGIPEDLRDEADRLRLEAVHQQRGGDGPKQCAEVRTFGGRNAETLYVGGAGRKRREPRVRLA